MGIFKFIVGYRVHVYIVNELSLVADILVEKLTSVVFTFILYKKKSENETIQVSSKCTNESYPGLPS